MDPPALTMSQPYYNYSKWKKMVLPKKEFSNVARKDLSRREPVREVKSRDP